MPDLHEAGWQDMNEESPDKFKDRYRHDLPCGIVFVIPPLEADLLILDLEDALVGDCDPMSVTSEVFHDTGGVPERRFAVNHPFFAVE